MTVLSSYILLLIVTINLSKINYSTSTSQMSRQMNFENDTLREIIMAKSKKSVNVIKPVPALCEPELQKIHFHSDEFNLNDPNIIYQPSCTRVKKCGGCCNSPLLSCQSLQSSITNFEVMVFKHEVKENENSKIVFQGNYIIPVEIDTKCKCACTIKEKDCTQRQSYDPMRCKCFCKNWQDEDKCGENISEGKTWNPSTCECSFD